MFCDVERPLTSRFIRGINNWIGRPLAHAAATQNLPGEKAGILNQLFGYVYQIRRVAKRLKAWNKTTYYVLKWALLGALTYWAFLSR